MFGGILFFGRRSDDFSNRPGDEVDDSSVLAPQLEDSVGAAGRLVGAEGGADPFGAEVGHWIEGEESRGARGEVAGGGEGVTGGHHGDEQGY